MHFALYARYKLGKVLALQDLRLEVICKDFITKFDGESSMEPTSRCLPNVLTPLFVPSDAFRSLWR